MADRRRRQRADQLTDTEGARTYTSIPSPDGRRLIYHLDEGAELFEIDGELPQRTSTPLPRLEGDGHFRAIRFSPDGTQLVGSNHATGAIHLYSFATKSYRELGENRGFPFWIDDARLAVAFLQTVKIFDTSSLQLLGEVRLERGFPFDADPDRLYLLHTETRADLWLLTPGDT